MSVQKPSTGSVVREVKGWAIATNFAFTVAGGCLIGWVLERYVWPGAKPWLLLGGAFAGLVSGGYRFVKEAMAANRSVSRNPKQN
ncbi:MAG: AtpZ/AtpI family protein [Phycisphaerae bacterium]|nr:AtpZ/AtpI family protein [Phycisphaerae bacterium]